MVASSRKLFNWLKILEKTFQSSKVQEQGEGDDTVRVTDPCFSFFHLFLLVLVSVWVGSPHGGEMAAYNPLPPNQPQKKERECVSEKFQAEPR